MAAKSEPVFRMAVRTILALLTLIGTNCAAAQTPDALFPDDVVMRQRYALPGSRFVNIAGEDVHYVDEGRGPAILLLHGSYASLRQWNAMARVLAERYRVIRYDQSPAGLSSPSATHDYSLDHRLQVIDALMDRLGVARFVIMGTSSSGLPTTAYAATRPTRVTGVILTDIAVANVAFDLASLPQGLRDALAEDRGHPGFHRPEYWRQILLANVADKARVTPELVREWTDLNHRALRDPQIGKAVFAQMTPFTRSIEDLARITAPTLILWGQDDHETTLAQHGIPAFAASAASDKTLELIPHCGHMLPLDCPAQALERTLPFLQRVSGR